MQSIGLCPQRECRKDPSEGLSVTLFVPYRHVVLGKVASRVYLPVGTELQAEQLVPWGMEVGGRL